MGAAHAAHASYRRPAPGDDAVAPHARIHPAHALRGGRRASSRPGSGQRQRASHTEIDAVAEQMDYTCSVGPTADASRSNRQAWGT